MKLTRSITSSCLRLGKVLAMLTPLWMLSFITQRAAIITSLQLALPLTLFSSASVHLRLAASWYELSRL